MCGPLRNLSIFRVLVIDDQVCEGRETVSARTFQEGISAYIHHLAAGRIENVDICFAGTPEEGVSLWKNEIFDLTLVDSDLTATSPKDKSEIQSFLDIIPTLKGVYIFRLLWDLMPAPEENRQSKSPGSKEYPFAPYRDGCKVVLWTGLRSKSIDEEKASEIEERNDKLKRLLAPCLDASGWFIPKRNDDPEAQWKELFNENDLGGRKSPVTSLESCLQEALSRLEKPVNWRSLLARYVTLYRSKTPDEFHRLVGLDEWVEHGFLFCKGNSVFFSNSKPDGITEYVELSPLLRYGNPSFRGLIREGNGSDAERTEGEEPNNHKDWADKSGEIGEKFFSQTVVDIRKFPLSGIIVPKDNGASQRESQDSPVIAAATPLTGCSAVGRKYAIRLMVKKINALLDGPFEKVVLKTVYLDSLNQWKNLQWPTLQAQSHHRTRCLRSTAHPRTLWNTGKTAMESFTPGMMHDFLARFAKDNPGKCQHVIVSLGSKFPQWNLNTRIKTRNAELKARGCKDEDLLPPKAYRDHLQVFLNHINDLKKDLKKIWHALFSEIFDLKKEKNEPSLKGENTYPFVEINVRHYLRECVAYHLGGHEYLGPAKIDPDREKNELDFTGCYLSLDQEFNAWLEVLDDIAKKFGKKLFLKLPFRGDVLHFIRLIRDYADTHAGTSIEGITLINAFKSGLPEPRMATPFSPAWYGYYDVKTDQKDKRWGLQMSGESLKASRYEIAGEASKLAESKVLKVQVSGGIMDSLDIAYCTEELHFSAVQIGTWALMDLNLSNQSWTDCASIPPAVGVGRPKIHKCLGRCPQCAVVCPHGAFTQGKSGTPAKIDSGKCVNCKLCASLCRGKGKFGVVLHTGSAKTDNRPLDNCVQIINPRIAFCLHELCNGCGKCSRTFYCDTFMDRRGLDLPPMMDSRNCTGCGLCAQTCPRGAIQLFDPKHVAVLIGKDREVLTAWHRRLTAYEIPHLVYETTKIAANYKYCKKYCKKTVANGNGGDEPSEEEMFGWRITNDSFFDKMSEDYVDERKWAATDIGRDTKGPYAKEILEKVAPDSVFRKWLFLAWSDPGQVLKDSPVLYATDAKECQYYCSGETGSGLNLQKLLERPGLKEIRVEVERRLRNLREGR